MKHLKIYESYNEGKPKIGDYVICHNTECDEDDQYLYKFLFTTIGQIIGEGSSFNRYSKTFTIEFPKSEDLLRVWRDNKQVFGLEEILFWSDNKEDLEMILNSNKYNL